MEIFEKVAINDLTWTALYYSQITNRCSLHNTDLQIQQIILIETFFISSTKMQYLRDCYITLLSVQNKKGNQVYTYRRAKCSVKKNNHIKVNNNAK